MHALSTRPLRGWQVVSCTNAVVLVATGHTVGPQVQVCCPMQVEASLRVTVVVVRSSDPLPGRIYLFCCDLTQDPVTD